MKKLLRTTVGILPGPALSLLIAVLACFLEGLLPIHLIGASVIAMFGGGYGYRLFHVGDLPV